MIVRKFLTFWILFLFFLNFQKCQEIVKELVRRNEKYYTADSNDEIPNDMRDGIEIDPTALVITGSSENDTSVLITTLREHEVQWTFCRDETLQCTNKEQEFSVCYHNGNMNAMIETNSDINKECEGKRMCKIKVKLNKREHYIFGSGFSGSGSLFEAKNKCFVINLFALNPETVGHIRILNNNNVQQTGGGSIDACKIYTTKLPRTNKFQTQIIVRQGINNDGCNIKMSSYQSNLIIKGIRIPSPLTTPTIFPHTFVSTEKIPAVAKFFDNWKYLIIVIIVIFIIAIISAIVIKRKWLKKQFQKKKKNLNSSVPGRGNGNGASEKQETQGTTFDETTPYISNRQKNNAEKAMAAQNEKKKKDETTKKISLKDGKPGATTIEMKPLQIHPIPATKTNAIPSSLQPSSTQPSLSCDSTPPKTQAEMTPDELEYLAFSTPDTGKRYRIFRTAVKLAEKIAESHGFWINDRDPTVPGDEEDWLKNHADSLTKTCVEIHGVSVPDIGATHNEHLDYIDKHSLRDIYIIALYTEVEEPTRMFFLTSVIDRFREVVKQIPTNELEKAPHPLPLLLRVYQEHPSVFGLRPPKKNNDKKPNNKKQ